MESLISSVINSDGLIRAEIAGSDRSTKYQFLFNQHTYLNNASRFADLKAAALAGVNGTLLGLIIRQITFSTPLTLSIFFMGAGILFASIAMALWVAYPRRRARYQKSLLYWEGVRAHTEDEYVQRLTQISRKDLLEHLMRHNYLLSDILSKKYSTLSLAFIIAVVGYVVLAMSLLINHVM